MSIMSLLKSRTVRRTIYLALLPIVKMAIQKYQIPIPIEQVDQYIYGLLCLGIIHGRATATQQIATTPGRDKAMKAAIMGLVITLLTVPALADCSFVLAPIQHVDGCVYSFCVLDSGPANACKGAEIEWAIGLTINEEFVPVYMGTGWVYVPWKVGIAPGTWNIVIQVKSSKGEYMPDITTTLNAGGCNQ